MFDVNIVLAGFADALTLYNFFFVLFGVIIGQLVGALPGTGPVMAMAICFTAAMPTGANVYVLAERYQFYTRRASSIV